MWGGRGGGTGFFVALPRPLGPQPAQLIEILLPSRVRLIFWSRPQFQPTVLSSELGRCRYHGDAPSCQLDSEHLQWVGSGGYVLQL